MYLYISAVRCLSRSDATRRGNLCKRHTSWQTYTSLSLSIHIYLSIYLSICIYI